MALSPPSTSYIVDGVPAGPTESPLSPPVGGSPTIGTIDPPSYESRTTSGLSRQDIFSQILRSSPTNFQFLQSVGKQASLLTAAFGQESPGTLTAAKPSPKPFIVGFIVPDVAVNYVPISQVKSKIRDINAAAPTKPPKPASDKGYRYPAIKPGPLGTQAKVRTTLSTSDLKSGIVAAYTAVTGSPPTPQTLALIYSHMCGEQGIPAGTKSFACDNFNFGNIHSGGGATVDYPKGGRLPPPSSSTPTGGSYFWTTDHKADGTPYGVYMQSFSDLPSGIQAHITMLLHQWPGTATAQTVEEYNQALLGASRGGTAPGGSYYELPSDEYAARLKAQYSALSASGGAPPLDPTITASDPSSTKPSDGAPIGAIMNNGDVCYGIGDNLDSTYGRNIRVDDQRLEITDKYIASIREDIEQFKLTPPLLLLVNPETFERSYEAAVDSSAKGRQGHIVHLWIEKPMSISSKGVTAGQYSIDASGQGGLTSLNRVQSLSYQNLLSLVMMYKNNGIIFDKFSRDSGSLGVPIIQMSVYIYYDNRLYIGSFDDFSVDDSADKPYNMEYSFRFNVRYETEVDSNSITDTAIIGQYASTSLTSVGSRQTQQTILTNNPATPPIAPIGTL